MKYLDHFKNISIAIPAIAIDIKRNDNGDPVLNEIGKQVYITKPAGTVINLIRNAYGFDPIPAIDGKGTIDRFELYRLISSVIDGNVYHSHWYYRYPSIVAAMSLFTPNLIGASEIKGDDLKTLIFPYVRLIESQNKINFGISEDNGIEFQTETALQKISTKAIKLIDRYAIGKSNKIQTDRVSRFVVGGSTPHAISQNIKFISNGDRYSRVIEHRSYSHVIQMGFIFKFPGDRGYVKKGNKTFLTLADLQLFSYNKITAERQKAVIARLEIGTDRILKIRLFQNNESLEKFPGIDPEILGYLLAMVGFRRLTWKENNSYQCTNFPKISPFSDILTWHGLGIEIELTRSHKIAVTNYCPANHALKCEVIKKGKDDPIVKYT